MAIGWLSPLFKGAGIKNINEILVIKNWAWGMVMGTANKLHQQKCWMERSKKFSGQNEDLWVIHKSADHFFGLFRSPPCLSYAVPFFTPFLPSLTIFPEPPLPPGRSANLWMVPISYLISRHSPSLASFPSQLFWVLFLIFKFKFWRINLSYPLHPFTLHPFTLFTHLHPIII